MIVYLYLSLKFKKIIPSIKDLIYGLIIHGHFQYAYVYIKLLALKIDFETKVLISLHSQQACRNDAVTYYKIFLSYIVLYIDTQTLIKNQKLEFQKS